MLWFSLRYSAVVAVTLFSSSVHGLSKLCTEVKPSSALRGPTKWPIIGTLPDFLSKGGADALFDVHSAMYHEYGSIYSMSILGDDEAILCDPREYQKVFRSEGKYPYGSAQDAKVFVEYHEEKGNQFAVNSLKDGEDWKNWRQQLAPDIFAPTAAKSYMPFIADAARDASAVADQYGDNFDSLISRLAFDMFCGIMYGKNPGTADAANAEPRDLQFVTETQEAFNLAGIMMLNPQEKLFKSDKYSNFVKAMDNSMDFAKKRTEYFIELAREKQSSEAREISVNGETESIEESSGKCPVQTVMDAVNPKSQSCVARLVEKDQMSSDELAENVGSLVIAGVDTTAYIVGWLFLNLANNPSVQDNLFEELNGVLEGSDLSEDSLDKLPYLQACMRESHRLTPPVPITGVRRLPRDITMNDYNFPAGMRLSLNVAAYQNDPEYVEHPKEYKPERWLEDAVQARKGTEAEVIDHRLFSTPFSSGLRMCLGARVAELEILSATARFFQDWNIVFDPPEQEWTLKQGLFVKADPFPKFKLVRR